MKDTTLLMCPHKKMHASIPKILFKESQMALADSKVDDIFIAAHHMLLEL
jgi:hypothetical protein